MQTRTAEIGGPMESDDAADKLKDTVDKD